MKILLFGGSGFVSGRVLHFALEGGHDVTCVTRSDQPFTVAGDFKHIKANRNEADLSTLADAQDFDVVLDIISQNPDHARQSIDLAHGGKRLVMVSSDYAYDPEHRHLCLKESDARFSDRDDYGGNKRRAELALLAAAADGTCRPTILRPPHIYGPGSNPGTIPQHGRRPTLLQDIRDGKTLNLLHGGLGLIQPIHVDDLARLILTVAECDDAVGEDYTAAGPELMTHLEYYQALARCLGEDIRMTAYCPGPDAQDVSIYVAGHRYYDMSKLNALLPDFTFIPFSRGVEAWVAHLLEGGAP